METTDRLPDPGTVLGVWAHPDDEAYLSAGLMAVARDRGRRVVVATATAGELGTPDPSWPVERVARLRLWELATSLSELSVREHRFLGLPDGGCEARWDEGEAWAHRLVEEVRPDTIVTFGPDGMTGHADHRAVSAWATSAWEATGRRARLWYATMTPGYLAEWAEVNDALGVWMDDGEPSSTPEHHLAATVHCTGDLLERKARALAAHRSQTAPVVAALGRRDFLRWSATEWFVDAETHHRRSCVPEPAHDWLRDARMAG